jgi:CheY-like chemotaxis protein
MKNGKTNIMVVDDEEMIRKMMLAMLSPQGYVVTLARNGKEAVDLAASKKPDFIFMDMMMPEMDGLTACNKLKNNPATRGIPVFMLTALADEGNKQMAQKVWGADGYLTKPVDLKELLETIAQRLPVS